MQPLDFLSPKHPCSRGGVLVPFDCVRALNDTARAEFALSISMRQFALRNIGLNYRKQFIRNRLLVRGGRPRRGIGYAKLSARMRPFANRALKISWVCRMPSSIG